MQGDRGPCRRRQIEAHPTNHVLPHINDGFTGWSLQDPYRFDFLNLADWRSSRSNEPGFWRIKHGDARPSFVVIASLAPSRPLETRVICFSIVDFGLEDGPSRGSPIRVRPESIVCAVCVLDYNLSQQSQLVTVRVASAFPSNGAAEPAVSKQSAQAVLALFQEAGDVEGLILEAKVVSRPAGSKVLVANSLAVKFQLVQTHCGNINTGLRDGFLH